MILCPLAVPFFSCTFQESLLVRENKLNHARLSLTPKDFCLFESILNEWESSPLLSVLFQEWDRYVKPDLHSITNSLDVLSFNVRGLDGRVQEVLLLTISFDFDVLILLEVGVFDHSSILKFFPKHRFFFQAGENRNGGVVILIRNDLKVKRLDCAIPNVVALDLDLEESIRLIGVYGPESKTWNWQDLSKFCDEKSVVFGDYNIDLEKDGKKAESFLE